MSPSSQRPLPTAWREIAMDDVRRLICGLVLAAVTLIASTSLNPLSAQNVDPATLNGHMDGAGNLLRQSLYVACLLATLLATRPVMQPARIIALPPRLLLLFALCALSLLWSVAPAAGARRLILVMILYWIAYRNVQELGVRAALGVMAATLTGALLADWAAVILTPNAVHQGFDTMEGSLAGDWRGIFPHKNEAGPVTAFTIFYLLFLKGRLNRILRLVLLVAAIIFLVKTGSKTSMALALVGVTAGCAFLLYNPAYRMLLIPATMVVGAIGTLLISMYVPGYLAWLQTQPDAFTGRVPIWQTMLGFINDHPMSGAGFGSFWDSGPVSPSNTYSRGWVASMVTQGHNGYLDIWTQIGLPGMILTVTLLFVVPLAKLLFASGLDRRSGAILVASCIFLIGHNFTESTMLMRDFFGNFMLAFTIACVDSLVRSAPKAPSGRPWRDPVAPHGRVDQLTLRRG